MLDAVSRWLFDPSGLTPHGFCLLWEPGLLWLHALADICVGLAYFSIPAALFVFLRRRPDLVFRPVFWLFAAFILLCGGGHFIEVLTLWVPAYGIEGLVKAATAVVSIITAIALWHLLPDALSLPSPSQMRDATAALVESEARLRQAQKMEAIGQLTGGVAHDFNNMLQGISGSIELMHRRIEQGHADEALRFVETARRSVVRASSLTHRMLAFARRQALTPRPVEPDQLVQGMAELIRRTVGLQVRLELPAYAGRSAALCDANELESALLNLAINARDAMPQGGTLTIAARDRDVAADDTAAPQDATPGRYVEFLVADTGTGMEPEVLERAFEPFFTTKPPGRGTGLGLSQIYGFAQQSGGFVRIESTLGAGTVVHLFVPRVERQTGTDAAPARTANGHGAGDDTSPASVETRGAPLGATVLVIEDETTVRVQLVASLADLGCSVLAARDARAGIALAQSQRRLDLLVTDVGLPGSNGLEAAEAIRRLHPGMPVLLITGYAPTLRDDVTLAPHTDILNKPFDLEALAGRVRALLETALVR
jgi:signal transduction histidine kinase